LRTDAFVDAAQVGFAVQCGSCSLRVPDRFAEALQECVFRVVVVTDSREQSSMRIGDSGRLVDGELFLDCEMQR
jgi:hypothetical protein